MLESPPLQIQLLLYISKLNMTYGTVCAKIEDAKRAGDESLERILTIKADMMKQILLDLANMIDD